MDRRDFSGYAEIGSKGRYFGSLTKNLRISGPTYFIEEKAPSFSVPDVMERGKVTKLKQYLPLADYAPLPTAIKSESLDLVTCYIGLHHMTLAQLCPFLESVARVLRPGGVFIVRDHDVNTPEMFALVALAHIVFNAGLGESWETNEKELRFFVSAQEWSLRLQAAGLHDTGQRLLQENDPTMNTLMAFVKLEQGE